MALNTLKRPLKSLPTFGSQDSRTGSCLINIRQMASADVRYWNRHVQPLIKALYDEWPASVPVDWLHPAGIDLGAIRADVGWDWERIFLLAKCHNYLRPLSSAREQAHAWCLELSDTNGGIPIGLLTAVPAYGSPVQGDRSKMGFVWYLADAPAEFYVTMRLDPVAGVARALVDTAIQMRLDLDDDAAVFLHADPKGGRKLIEFYGERCGMTRIRNPKRYISPCRRPMPGEYFYMDDQAGRRFCATHDDRRLVLES
ncbi:hypothetical protein [Paraburkholderia pallida]|uniref:N-acetyltransferase n=1 Tax=Paraburkholderia pallida TaxID=2547399 RepID=A0A4P7CTP1_9BURK|nr:hypothetical protein [Paraburkholderia pallida]QBQ98136.1 hypothetical protein E1956_13785 [Paraburkholderia pallida]